MTRPLILLNKRFNHWRVLYRYENDTNGKTRWLCQCDCGKKSIVLGSNLTSGKSKRCNGCGESKTIKFKNEYHIWQGIKDRCFNKNNKHYKDYGERGIVVSNEWLVFDNFLNDMGRKPKNMSIDRIDNNGNYCKENCRWATNQEQMNNTRQNRKVRLLNKMYTSAQLSRKFNIKRGIVYQRIFNLGWDVKAAVETPVKSRKKVINIK